MASVKTDQVNLKTQKRPSILLVIPSLQIAEKFLANDAFGDVLDRFDVAIISPPENGFASQIPVHTVALAHTKNRLLRAADFHFWNLALMAHLRKKKISPATSLKFANLPKKYLRLYQLLSSRSFSWLTQIVDRYILFRNDPGVREVLDKLRPALVLAPGSAIDTYSHFVIRTAESRLVPTAIVVSHWDFFSKKGLLRTRANRVYVWGQDMRQLAIDTGVVKPETIRILGVPQFEHYKRLPKATRSAYREKLGLAENDIAVLFAGTLMPYDELSAVEELLRYLVQNKRQNVKLIYRAHPRAWARRGPKAVAADLAHLLIVDDATDTSTAHYQAIMSSVDGVVSPFSTMILEAAICRKPSLCLGFSDGVNDMDFAMAAISNEHLRILRDRDWLDACYDRSELSEKFSLFLGRVETWRESPSSHRDIDRTIYDDDIPYSTRLATQLESDFICA